MVHLSWEYLAENTVVALVYEAIDHVTVFNYFMGIQNIQKTSSQTLQSSIFHKLNYIGTTQPFKQAHACFILIAKCKITNQ